MKISSMLEQISAQGYRMPYARVQPFQTSICSDFPKIKLFPYTGTKIIHLAFICVLHSLMLKQDETLTPDSLSLTSL